MSSGFILAFSFFMYIFCALVVRLCLVSLTIWLLKLSIKAAFDSIMVTNLALSVWKKRHKNLRKMPEKSSVSRLFEDFKNCLFKL